MLNTMQSLTVTSVSEVALASPGLLFLFSSVSVDKLVRVLVPGLLQSVTAYS